MGEREGRQWGRERVGTRGRGREKGNERETYDKILDKDKR